MKYVLIGAVYFVVLFVGTIGGYLTYLTIQKLRGRNG